MQRPRDDIIRPGVFFVKKKPRQTCLGLERVMGIEPTSQAWEARILPMNYTRKVWGYYNKAH